MGIGLCGQSCEGRIVEIWLWNMGRGDYGTAYGSCAKEGCGTGYRWRNGCGRRLRLQCERVREGGGAFPITRAKNLASNAHIRTWTQYQESVGARAHEKRKEREKQCHSIIRGFMRQ